MPTQPHPQGSGTPPGTVTPSPPWAACATAAPLLRRKSSNEHLREGRRRHLIRPPSNWSTNVTGLKVCMGAKNSHVPVSIPPSLSLEVHPLCGPWGWNSSQHQVPTSGHEMPFQLLVMLFFGGSYKILPSHRCCTFFLLPVPPLRISAGSGVWLYCLL